MVNNTIRKIVEMGCMKQIVVCFKKKGCLGELLIYKFDLFFSPSYYSANQYINYLMKLFKVESILDKRIHPNTRKTQYRIKWQDYPVEQSTWEPLSNLNFIRDLIKQFEDDKKNNLVSQKDKVQSSKKENKLLQSSDRQEPFAQPIPTHPLIESHSRSRPPSEKQSKGQPKGPRRIKKTTDAVKKKKKLMKQSSSQSLEQSEEQQGGRMSEGSRRKKINRMKQKEPVLSEQIKQLEKMDNQDQESLEEVLDYEVKREKLQDQHFVIKQLCRRNQTFIYLVEEHGETRWASKSQILRQHTLALIQFYQSRIKYSPKHKAQSRLEQLRKLKK